MKYRVTEILGSTTLETSAQTKSIPLNLSDPISALIFEYKNTIGSATMIEHIAACLPSISLVDGSDVIFSLSAKEMVALAHYDRGVGPYSMVSNTPTVQSILGIPYNFGRKLWDPMLAFDPKKYRNPVLNISHSYRLSDASSAAHYLRIMALCFDEKAVSPSGYLMSKEIASPPWVASGSKSDLVLPNDYPIRKLLLRGYLDDMFPHQVIQHIKISEDNDKKVPMDEDTTAWMRVIGMLYPRYHEGALLNVTTSSGYDIFCTPSFDINVAGAQLAGTTPMIIEKQGLNVPFLMVGAANEPGKYEITGHLPHACIPVPFGDQDDPDDWYDAAAVKSLHLIMTGGSAGTSSVVNVVAQQLRKY